jgi:hypothetical protein
VRPVDGLTVLLAELFDRLAGGGGLIGPEGGRGWGYGEGDVALPKGGRTGVGVERSKRRVGQWAVSACSAVRLSRVRRRGYQAWEGGASRGLGWVGRWICCAFMGSWGG